MHPADEPAPRDLAGLSSILVATSVSWLRHVTESLLAQHGALPIRRSSIARARWCIEWLVGRREKSADAFGVGDHRQELHAALALRTLEHINGECSPQKLGQGR